MSKKYKTNEAQAGPPAQKELMYELEKLNEWTVPCSPSSETPLHAGQPNTDEFDIVPDLSGQLTDDTAAEKFRSLDEESEDTEDEELSDALLEFPKGSLIDGTITFAADGSADPFNT